MREEGGLDRLDWEWLERIKILKYILGNSLVAQWLGLHPFTAKGPRPIPDWGTKILQGKNRKKIYIVIHIHIYTEGNIKRISRGADMQCEGRGEVEVDSRVFVAGRKELLFTKKRGTERRLLGGGHQELFVGLI